MRFPFYSSVDKAVLPGRSTILLVLGLSWVSGTPEPQMVPAPAEASDAAYSPQALLPGGVVVPLYSPDSGFLQADRIHEAEEYRMANGVPGRVNQIVNIHNPSIEFHPANLGQNTGATIILVPGGGHKTLNVAGAGTDFVPYFFNYGVNTVILRYRLRSDGYNAEIDAVNDTMQAIRLVRAHAKDWKLDPRKIGVIGFSAGGEPSGAAGIGYERFDAENAGAGDGLGGISARPDFVGLIFTGPTPLSRDPELTFPREVPPVFMAGASYGEDRHTQWALDYYLPMLRAKVPNIEVHFYGNGGHGGGLQDRSGIPWGTWQDRFIDWFRDLGFLDKRGVPTKAALDIEAHASS